MNKEKLNTLLDSIYELEGLVHLAITRDDEPAMLPELIRRKSRELMAHAEKATADDSAEVESQTYVAIEETPIETAPKYDDPTQAQDYDDTSAQEYVEDLVESEGVAGIPVMPEPVMPVVAEPVIPEEEPVIRESEVLSVFGTAPEPEPEPAPVAAPVSKSESEPVRKVAPAPERKPVSEKETYKFQEYTEPRGRLVFSINDRYRFKRELFHGSDTDFNTTLSLVASMEGYDEAEDYFLNDLQWDEKSPDVIDFLEILKNYFK